MKYDHIRLSENKIKKIKDTILHYFNGEHVDVYIFGSRIDPVKKGGDIDIMIKLEKSIFDKEKFEAKVKILSNLYKVLGERKIDLLIVDEPEKMIEKIALREGIKI